MNKNLVNSSRLGLCVVSGLLVLAPLRAQIGGSGSIQGVLSDSTGAVVPGAAVTATNVATGVANVRTTTPAGYYVISPLQPGEYTVTVSATGFEKLTQQHVVVRLTAAKRCRFLMRALVWWTSFPPLPRQNIRLWRLLLL